MRQCSPHVSNSSILHLNHIGIHDSSVSFILPKPNYRIYLGAGDLLFSSYTIRMGLHILGANEYTTACFLHRLWLFWNHGFPNSTRLITNSQSTQLRTSGICLLVNSLLRTPEPRHEKAASRILSAKAFWEHFVRHSGEQPTRNTKHSPTTISKHLYYNRANGKDTITWALKTSKDPS